MSTPPAPPPPAMSDAHRWELERLRHRLITEEAGQNFPLIQALDAALRACPAAPADATPLCVCGHTPDEHGSNGVGHCGATKACRAGGCKAFRAAPPALGSPLAAEAATDGCAKCGKPEKMHPVVYVGNGEMQPVLKCYEFASPTAAPPQGQQGPPLKSPYGHVWGKPYDDGYATCRCGAREDTRSRERCHAAPTQAAPDVVDGQCQFCGERDGKHGEWCRR